MRQQRRRYESVNATIYIVVADGPDRAGRRTVPGVGLMGLVRRFGTNDRTGSRNNPVLHRGGCGVNAAPRFHSRRLPVAIRIRPALRRSRQCKSSRAFVPCKSRHRRGRFKPPVLCNTREKRAADASPPDGKLPNLPNENAPISQCPRLDHDYARGSRVRASRCIVHFAGGGFSFLFIRAIRS